MTAHYDFTVYDALLSALQTGLRTRLFTTTDERNRWTVCTEFETAEQYRAAHKPMPLVSLYLPDVSQETLPSRRYRFTSTFAIVGAVDIVPGASSRAAISALAYRIEDALADDFCLGGTVAQTNVIRRVYSVDTENRIALVQITVTCAGHYVYTSPGTA